MNNFELVLEGFDGGNDEMDSLVVWVAAESKAHVDQFINDHGLTPVVKFGDELPDSYTSEDGIDFQLPQQSDEARERILALIGNSAKSRPAP